MPRNTKILSEKELFEKTKGIVEHAINTKINLTFKKGDNFCTFHSPLKNNKLEKKMYTINIATPADKCINKYTALIHELGHVLYKSPFTPIMKLLKNSENSKYYFSIFSILEDHRIESHLSENYLAYRQKFEKTCNDLGEELEDQETFDSLYILFAIRFNQEKKVKNAKNFLHYKKALEDVKNTDEFGALRVLISIKKYIEEDLILDSISAGNENSDSNEDSLTLTLDQQLKKYIEDDLILDSISAGKKNNNTNEYNSTDLKQRKENLKKDLTTLSHNFQFNNLYKEVVKKMDYNKQSDSYNSDSEDKLIPKELRADSFNDEEIKKILEKGKILGKKQFEEIQERMLSVNTISENLPSNVIKTNRGESDFTIDYKVSSNLNKLFKKLKMKNKPYVDYQGYEIDIEEYVNNLICGININKSFENNKKSQGSSIVISIDGSKSMDGNPIKIAQKLVATIYQSLKGIPEIEVKGNIWAGDMDGNVGITEINSMKDVKKITFDQTHHYWSTPTHMGIEYSGLMLKKMKGEKKLLILITDGVPQFNKNGRQIPSAQYNEVCKKSLQRVLQITPNVLCFIVNKDNLGILGFNNLFGEKRIIHVKNMNKAFDNVVKQFKKFIQSHSMNYF